jgi:hypothetical protein
VEASEDYNMFWSECTQTLRKFKQAWDHTHFRRKKTQRYLCIRDAQYYALLLLSGVIFWDKPNSKQTSMWIQKKGIKECLKSMSSNFFSTRLRNYFK